MKTIVTQAVIGYERDSRGNILRTIARNTWSDGTVTTDRYTTEQAPNARDAWLDAIAAKIDA